MAHVVQVHVAGSMSHLCEVSARIHHAAKVVLPRRLLRHVKHHQRIVHEGFG